MDVQDIAYARLANQHISSGLLSSPVEVVRSLGALQAQAYKDALWAVGLRCKDTTQSEVEAAIAEKKIIRTWSMRGTWHFVPPSEVRWMLSLYPESPIPSYQRSYGLTEQTLEKGLDMIRKAFKGEEALTYREIGNILAKSGVAELKKTDVQRHIARRAGKMGIICFSKQVGNQPAFRLLNAMVPKTDEHTREAALAKFAKVYFESHGPATLKDFTWWSGLRVSEARAGIEMVRSSLNEAVVDGKAYLMSKRKAHASRDESRVHLLPSFDEYLISYSDRSAALMERDDAKKIISGSTFFFLPTVIADGKVVGTWRRSSAKKGSMVSVKPFRKFTSEETSGLKEEVNRYGGFLETEALLRLIG